MTNATRTLVDLASEVDENELELMLDAALRSGKTSLTRMRWRLQQLGSGHHGCHVLKRLVDGQLSGGLSESALETLIGRVLRQMKRRGFPVPERQFVVKLGRGTGRLDFAFPHFKVGLEGDGRQWHGPGRWESDLRRENAFRQAGWDVRRFSWRDATKDPAYILDETEAALRLAGWRPFVQGTLG